MPTTSPPDRIRAFLAEPQPAVIASVRPDGQPVSVATWYLLDGDEVLVNMDAGRRRLAYLRSDPRVSLTVLDGVDWHTHVSLQDRIVR
jgi:PPOX class probable F420-dependent enzyme